MAYGSRETSNRVADPERRAYLRALRTIRQQVLKEHEKKLAETGFLGRVMLRLRIEMEIRKRSREVPVPRRR